MAKKKKLVIVAGTTYVYKKGQLIRIGPPAKECTCGQGWSLCDYCFERG